MSVKIALHVSPHPDDESVGVPCTLLALQDGDWQVVNVVCSLGREEKHWDRRRQEVGAAAKIGKFQNFIPEPPVRLSSGDNHRVAQRLITNIVRPWLANPDVQLVIGPHLDDGHHAHETVARGIRDALIEADRPIPWWMWSIWRDLPQPTMYVPCDPQHVDLSEKMIKAYPGENSRNSYTAMHRARRRVNAILGTERVFGFGAGIRNSTKWAELLAEVSYRDGEWVCGRPRQPKLLEPTDQWITSADSAAAERVLAALVTGSGASRTRLIRWFPTGQIWPVAEWARRTGSVPRAASRGLAPTAAAR